MKRTLVAALLAPLAACALGNVNLVQPTREIPADPTLGKARQIVVVAPFVDMRANPMRCGMKKNGYNMESGTVTCVEPPNVWLARLLELQLARAGFRVAPPGAEPATAVRIEGSLLQFFVEPDVGAFTFSPEADIWLRLRVTSASGLNAEREFYVKGIETSALGLDSNFQLASDAAVEQLLRAIVPAIVTLLDRYPGLGTPGGVGPVSVRLAGEVAQR